MIKIPYCNTLDVKKALDIGEEEEFADVEIKDLITSADAIIDRELSKSNLTVPSPTPQNIKDASKYFAAWLYKRKMDPAGAEVFKNEAEYFLQLYQDAQEDDIGMVVGTDES